MVTVTVYLHTRLQKKTPDGLKKRLEVNLNEGDTILDLVHFLDIDVDAEQILLALNGRITTLDQQLTDSDQVHLMMPISGG